MKKPRKITLALELSGIAALSFGFVSFMGVNFMKIDCEKVWGMPPVLGCITQALTISLILFGLTFGAQLLKRNKRNIRISIMAETIIILLFLLLATRLVFKDSPYIHYFTVSNQKEEINSKLSTSITQAENMFVDYEKYANNRIDNYRQTLSSVIIGKEGSPSTYNSYGFVRNNGVPDSSQAEYKISTLHNILFPSNYTDSIGKKGMKEVASTWLIKAKTTTNGRWRPIGIVSIVTDIEEVSTDWLQTLNDLSNKSEEPYSTPVFKKPLSFEDVKIHFTKHENPTNISIVLAVLAYLLMLLPWFIAKRDGGLAALTTKSYEVVL